MCYKNCINYYDNIIYSLYIYNYYYIYYSVKFCPHVIITPLDVTYSHSRLRSYCILFGCLQLVVLLLYYDHL